MKTVTAHRITIKNGAYEVLWETIILGDFHLGDVYATLAQTTPLSSLARDSVTYILRECGLPAEDTDYTYKKIAGTVIGTVIIKKLKVWTKE